MKINLSQNIADWKDWIRFAMVFILLTLLCVGATGGYLYTNSRNTVVVKNMDILPLSVNGHQVQQELRLEGPLEKILLYCSAPSGVAYQDALVTFTVQQGDKIIHSTKKAVELTSSIVLDNGLGRFEPGIATLTITGTEFPDGTDLYFFASQTQDSGLQVAQIDGSTTPGPLLMEYTIMRHDNYFIYDTVVLAALLVTLVAVAWLLTFQREQITKGKGLFFCSFVLLFVYISLRNPIATFLAEPRSEMVYEFWYKAQYLSFFDSLMSLMSGESLAWTERLMMWLAVRLAGDGKYVFVIAQLMQTTMVCAVSSMLCLPTFRRFFSAEIRLLVCWYLGGVLLFPSAYLFWAVSYWACFFLIPFAFVDMERLSKWQYGLALVLSIVLCVSRIYHILFIPMALLALFALGRKRGKRFSLYCIVVAVSSAFEVGYSMVMGGGGHIDLALLQPLHFLKNAVYYQVQVLTSLIFGKGILQGTLVNTAVFLLFIAVLVLSVFLLVFCWKDIKKRTYGCLLMALGILSFGSIIINVAVSGCSKSVMFPINYAADVDWSTAYYQNGDLHFSYSYFAAVAILLTLTVFIGNIVTESSATVCTGRGTCAGMAVAILLFTCVNVQEYIPLRNIEMSWKDSYFVTTHDSYYLPVNAAYPFAKISMYFNSASIVCGLTDDGQEALWAAGEQTYSTTYAYTTAAPGKVSDLAQRQMLSLSVQRKNLNFADPMVLVLLNEDGDELTRISQTNTPDRYYTDFFLAEPISGVYAVEFQYEDGSPAYVCSGMQIGITV